MKILIAPDKFKGSLSALEFCTTVEARIRAELCDAEVTSLPLADGGDGTIAVVNHYLQGTEIQTEVNDPVSYTHLTLSTIYSV